MSGSILNPKCVIAKDVNRYTYSCYDSCAALIVWEGGESNGPKTGATHYHAQLGLPDKCLVNGLALGC